MDTASSLASAAVRGDKAAISALVESVWPDAYRVAWSILGERTAAEDVAQEACARVLTSIAQLRDPQRFAPWFYRIVVNASKQRLRSAARTVAPQEDAAHVAGLGQEDRLDIQRALHSLDPTLRAVVVLRYYVGLNATQIATAISTSSMTVRWRLFVARKKLRELLDVRTAPRDVTSLRTGEYTDEPQAVR